MTKKEIAEWAGGVARIVTWQWVCVRQSHPNTYFGKICLVDEDRTEHGDALMEYVRKTEKQLTTTMRNVVRATYWGTARTERNAHNSAMAGTTATCVRLAERDILKAHKNGAPNEWSLTSFGWEVAVLMEETRMNAHATWLFKAYR